MGVFVHVGFQNPHQLFRPRVRTGQAHLIQNFTQGKQIGGVGRAGAFVQFGGPVAWCTRSTGQTAGKAQVDEAGMPAPTRIHVDDHIAGLEVLMHQTLAMDMGMCRDDIQGKGHGIGQRHSLFEMAFESLLEADATTERLTPEKRCRHPCRGRGCRQSGHWRKGRKCGPRPSCRACHPCPNRSPGGKP